MTESDFDIEVEITLNDQVVRTRVPARENLADFIRHRVGLTGTNVGCEQGVCGACTVLLDGRIVRSCLTLSAQANGRKVETIEGATASGRIADLQQAFLDHNAAQCGYCTPAMLLTASELLDIQPQPERDQIREFLSGNLCRCTGYHAIIDAIEQVGRERSGD